jgi:hypothetical protein
MPTPKPVRKAVKKALTFARKYEKKMGVHEMTTKSKNKSQKKELKALGKKGMLYNLAEKK